MATEITANFESGDPVYPHAPLHLQVAGGGRSAKKTVPSKGKKRGGATFKKKKGSKGKKRGKSTFRKKKGKKRGSFKRKKHSKRKVVQSIMKGLGGKRKSGKKSIKGGGWWSRNSSEVQEIRDQALMAGVDQTAMEACKKKGLFRKNRAHYNCIKKALDRENARRGAHGPHGHKEVWTERDRKNLVSDLGKIKTKRERELLSGATDRYSRISKS
tara:strand:+ start:2083 stop:2724 length:642 start_codon:yes stop_codon:yes gene_type:complete